MIWAKDMSQSITRVGVDFWAGLDSLCNKDAFARYRPAYITFELALILAASIFWIRAGNHGGIAFSPETWGVWACQFPAQFWAGLMLTGGTLTAMGLIHPPNRWQIALGGIIQASQFAALGLSAALTGGQEVIALFNFLLFVPFHLLVIIGAVRHGRG